LDDELHAGPPFGSRCAALDFARSRAHYRPRRTIAWSSAIVSLEVIFLTLFVLLNQNHMTVQAHKLAHLGFQITLLAEREMTLGTLDAVPHDN
jgi:hypothetical protein